MDRSQADPAQLHVPTLVARQETLARLVASIEPPFVDARLLLVEGPAGIGKTALLRAGLAQAQALGVATLRASPREAEVSYVHATLRDLLEDQLPSLVGDVSRAQLAALRTAFGDQVSADEETPSAQQGGIAVLAALRALIARGPTLVAIDDAGWVDQASREALTYALRRIGDVPLRLVMTQRSDARGGPTPFGLDDAARPIAIEHVWLEPLSLGALQSVLHSATGASFSRPTLLRIHEISAGNPFYAIELGRAIVAHGAVLRPGEDLPVPSSLRELVAGRINGQPRATRRLLLTAALSSAPTIELLNDRAGRDSRPIMRPAVDAGLIHVDAGSLSFSHPLFASTLIASASEDERLSTHAWLGQAPTEDFEARARHLALARTGTDATVAEQLARAAVRALQRGAPTVAGELADLSVERTPTQDPERVERALSAAEAWFTAGDFAAVRARVASLLPSLGGTHRARALTLDGLATWYIGTSREAVASLLPALADAGSDRALEGRIHYYLSVFLDYDLEAERRHAIAAADLLAATDDRGHLAAALLQAFYLSVILGDKPPLALLDQCLAVETQGRLVDRLTSPGIWWAAVGRLDLARERFRHMLEFDLIHGVYSNVTNLLTRQAEVELWADDWPAARSFATAAIEARLETGEEPVEMALRVLALVDALEGASDRADASAKAGVERTERIGASVLAAAWLQVSALVGASRDDAAAVAEATARAARHLQQIGFREPLRLDPAAERIEALAQLGQVDEATQELRALEGRQHKVPKPWAAAAIARGAARIALARDDTTAALAATEVVAAADPAGWSRFDVARVLLVRGEALRHARSRRAAAVVLTRAKETFANLGAPAWTRRADDELKRVGLTRSTALALTPTEARVARLAGEGLSTRAVAMELGISPRTVETHLAAIYGKLGVNSRAELGHTMARLEAE